MNEVDVASYTIYDFSKNVDFAKKVDVDVVSLFYFYITIGYHVKNSCYCTFNYFYASLQASIVNSFWPRKRLLVWNSSMKKKHNLLQFDNSISLSNL